MCIPLLLEVSFFPREGSNDGLLVSQLHRGSRSQLEASRLDQTAAPHIAVMDGPGPAPDGWEWHWSRTFERHYLWSPSTNAVRWPSAGTERAEGTGRPDGTAGPEGSASEQMDEDGAVRGLPGPTSVDCQPDTNGSAELVDDGSLAMGTDDGVNDCFVDFGDERVGFPDRRPAVTPQMHGWTYPPLIELADRLLCFGGEQTEVNVILEVSWSARSPPSHFRRMSSAADAPVTTPACAPLCCCQNRSVAGWAAQHGCWLNSLPRSARAHPQA